MRLRSLGIAAAVALATTLLVASPALAESPADTAGPVQTTASDDVLIQLQAELGEPRHFCVDIPGFPISGNINNHREAQWALETHTCKTGVSNQELAISDQLISRADLSQGRIRFTLVDACLRVAGPFAAVREDAPIVVDPCVGASQEGIVFGADGRIRPTLDPSKCLTAGEFAFEAGNRAPGQPWFRRALTFSTCEDGVADRQVWSVAEVPALDAPAPVDVPRKPRPDADPARQAWEVVSPPDNGLPGAPDADKAFIRLAEEIGEKRHFCVDIPGFPSSGNINNHREARWALETHSCKTDIENQNLFFSDQLISRASLEDNRLRFTLVNACLKIAFKGVPVREDAPVIVDPCTGAPEEEMVLGEDGRIRPIMDPTKCLTAGEEAFDAGSPAPGESFYRRQLTISTCTDPSPAGPNSLKKPLQGEITISSSAVSPGQEFTVSFADDHRGRFVAASFYSPASGLGGWVRVAEANTVTVTIPASATPGPHRISIQDSQGAVVGWTWITVMKAPRA